MERVCPSCGKNPGSGSLCRECGARVYRFAIDDDFEMPEDDLGDDSDLIDDDIPLDEITRVEIPTTDPSTWPAESPTEPVVVDPYRHSDEAPSTWVPVPPSSPTPPPGTGPTPADATTPKRSGCGCTGCLGVLFFLFMIAVIGLAAFRGMGDNQQLIEDFLRGIG